MKKLKIALVHDYIKEYGGAERVLETLHEIYPDAPVYTLVYLPEFLGPHRERFKDWNIKTSFLQYLPFKAKLISPFRLLAPWIFKLFDLSDFDCVIVSATGAYIPNLVHTKNKEQRAENKNSTVHICYCHTPPRYLYGYATARNWKKNVVFKIIGEIANHVLRMVDFQANKNVDYFIANSEEVAARIHKFYRKEATVIYPPVEFRIKNKESRIKGNKEYYLTGGRLARPKHVDLIVAACTKLQVPLKVFGKSFAGYGEELQQLAGETVEFLGEVTDEEKHILMRDAKAFIFASEDEDFGIVPVEAMGEGTPIIAYKSGGVKETVIDGKTGIFFEELTVESLVSAMRKFEKAKIDSKECMKQAEKFSKEKFIQRITAFIQDKVLSSSKILVTTVKI